MITLPININQKILKVIFDYKLEDNKYILELSEYNNSYILDKIKNQENNISLLLPCLNTFFCLDYLKINLIDNKFILNIFEFNNKKYILSDYFFYLISFSEINFELNFYTNLIEQLNINDNVKLITWNELNNDKFVENLCDFLKIYKPLDIDNFNLNYTVFFLYLNPIYTNKNIKSNKFNNFPKKIIQYGNNLKKEKFSYLESDYFKLEDHYLFLNSNINFNNYSNHYFYLFKNDKFKKIKLIKIKNKIVNCLIDDNELIIENVKLSVYPSINIKFNWEKLISYFILKQSKNVNNINNINNYINDNIEEYINNYNFPIKYDKKTLDSNFEKIILYFLDNLDENNDIIKIDDKYKIIYSKEIDKLLSNKNKIKLQLLLNNLIKILYNSKNNNYDKIIFNSKIYNDTLLFEVLKNLLENNEIDINIKTQYNFNKLKLYFTNIIIIKQILKIINWKNISNNLKQLKFLIENTNLLYFKGRYNRNVFPENFDNNIKKIIKEPLDMFKYLRSEKDFIRWIYFMDNINININNIYLNQVIINKNDYEILGEILYRFSILKEQNLKNNEYLYLLKICKNNKHLVLFNNRINIKLKEYFIKTNVLNLGFLAKHLNWEKDIDVSLEDISNDTIENFDKLSIEDLKKQFIIINKKYNKYKGKYIKLKTTTETTTIKGSVIKSK